MLFAVLGQASASEDRKIWMVVLGLLAVAIAALPIPLFMLAGGYFVK